MYLLVTHCEILRKFDQAILELKFMKVSKIGEEDSGLRIALVHIKWNLAQLQTLIIQQLQHRDNWNDVLHRFDSHLHFHQQFLDSNTESIDIGKKLWGHFEHFEIWKVHHS